MLSLKFQTLRGTQTRGCGISDYPNHSNSSRAIGSRHRLLLAVHLHVYHGIKLRSAHLIGHYVAQVRCTEW